MGAQSSEDEKTDEDDLLDMLDDTDNTELPREKYEELGLGDGLFNGKKIKRIVKVQSSDSKTKEGSKKKEGYKEEEGEAGEGMEKVHDIEDVESFHKIKSMKKIKKMTPIDADIADRMRKEVQEGTSESETTKSKHGKEEYNESSSSKQKIDDPDLTDKVTRILKMFNISDLDDIRKAVKISSMRKIKSHQWVMVLVILVNLGSIFPSIYVMVMMILILERTSKRKLLMSQMRAVLKLTLTSI